MSLKALTELTEGYDRAGLDGAEPRGRIQDWPLGVLDRGFTLPPRGCCSPAFRHMRKAAMSTPHCICEAAARLQG